MNMLQVEIVNFYSFFEREIKCMKNISITCIYGVRPDS